MTRRYVSNKRNRPYNQHADYGTPERWSHSPWDLWETNQQGLLAIHALQECALDRWLLEGLIDEEEHAAGLQLRADYHDAKLTSKVCRVYDQINKLPPQGFWSSAAEKRSPQAERAYQSWRNALQSVSTLSSSLLQAVCCDDRELSSGQNAAFRFALKQLKTHYEGILSS